MKKLHISEKDKVLAGVCSGLSESLGIEANIIRGAFLLSILFGFSGLWVYFICLIIFPKNDAESEIIDVEAEIEEEIQEKPRITRPWNDRMIAGVCSGIAKYLKWDVSLIRLLFALSLLVGGVGFFLYVLFWFIFPNENDLTSDINTRTKF